MNGVLPLWKPKGMTSHDCVMKLRRIFETKKVGHTGTLDPEVEGVLVVCIGQATKIVPYLTAMDKTYVAECTLGAATETEDAHGEIVERKKVINPPSAKELEEVFQLFRGEITQIPPMYSAIKVNGKRLYEYARANQHVERPSRQVYIYELTHINQEIKELTTFKYKVSCSAGTYIRTLCVDIGKKLGYPAHMSNLVRIESCGFRTEDTFTFEEIVKKKNEHKINNILIPIADSLKHLETIEVTAAVKTKVLHGQKLPKTGHMPTDNPFLITYEKQLLAIYQTHPENPDQIKPVRVFSI